MRLKTENFFRNICIGLVDGLTIPLAVAAGLSGFVESARPVVIACIAVAFAGALTMTFSGYFESKKYDPDTKPGITAVTIGTGYLLGGLTVSAPYFASEHPDGAFRNSIIISMLVLFVAGYFESRLNGSNGWINAFRVCITAGIAAAAALFVAKLFA